MRARIIAVVVSAVCAFARPSRADDVDACIEAAKVGQIERREGRIVDSIASFERCSRDRCPAVLRATCVKWLESAQESVPTVVFSARAGVRDLEEVRVDVDGKMVLERLTGKENLLNPGPHEVVFTRPSGERVVQNVLARAGEKARVIEVVFDEGRIEKPSPPPPPPRPPARSTEYPPPPPERSYVLPIVLGAVSASALGLAAYFQLSGSNDVRETRDACGAKCDDAQLDAIERVRTQKEWGARISLGVGVVAALAAVYTLVRTPSRTVATRDLVLVPTLGGLLFVRRF